ncbi:serine hydrolase family protein [Candidatus Woesearchaeota archaeon]|nr:serine hydrolase family protein [Candidatus Woesearchaeota archaeon]
MTNFILIHSTGGNPSEVFYPWLRKELEKKKHKVYAPFFPTPIGQTLENWMREFEPYWEFVNEETIFVGRSIGPAFILRLLERTDVKVKAAFLIAGFCSDIDLDEFKPLTYSFIKKPFNWQKIRKNCGRFFVYNSDNDPYVPLERGEELANNLGTELALVKGAEHFWFKKFPKILDDIRKCCQVKNFRKSV